MLSAFIGASVGGISFVFIRFLAVRKTHFIKIAFFFALFSALISPFVAWIENTYSDDQIEATESSFTFEVFMLYFTVATCFFGG